MSVRIRQPARRIKRLLFVIAIIFSACALLPLAHVSGSANADPDINSVPATYYGAVSSGPGFTPAAGMRVLASIGDTECGERLTQEVDGQVVYSVNVVAEGPGGLPNCGAPGRVVLFRIASVPMAPIAIWDAVVVQHPLAPMGVPAAPTVSIGRTVADVTLAWTQVTADVNGRATLTNGYDVWSSADPYFDPTEPDCDCALLVRTTDLTYPDEGAIGDLTVRFYVIQAVNPVGASANSNQVGKFEFLLVRGN